MKFATVIFASTILLSAAEPQAKKAAPAAPTPAPSTAPVPGTKKLTIPEGAVQMPDGRYTFTDSEGHHWIYVRTPMGISRFEDKPGSPSAGGGPVGPFAVPKSTDTFGNVKVTESGDTVKFERPSPFGTSKWEKKRSELTEQENAAMLRARDKTKSPDTSKQD